MLNHPTTQHKHLDKLVAHLRRSWMLQKLAYTLLAGIIVGLTVYWITGSVVLPAIGVSITTVLIGVVFSQSKSYQNITPSKVLQHLNRQFSECEESSELILQPSDSLTVLQQLQKTRIVPQVNKLLSSDLGKQLPQYSNKPAMLVGALILVILVLVEMILPKFLVNVEPTNTRVVAEQSIPSGQIKLDTKTINIAAPEYTGLAERQTTDLNLELFAGSTVTWSFQFNAITQQNNLSIMLPNKQRVALIQQTDNLYIASAELNQSGVYHIAVDGKMLGDIHTIAVTQDTRPTIRFIVPTQTITELAKDATPKLQAIVSIDDDFGLGKVEILASIASGSGEAVKFRDQTFQFDSQSLVADSLVESKTQFTKNWDLTELGMQPGDELYFSIRAWDNRQPVAQQSRSASKIIRWLEDEQQGVLVDGTLIDFMPEYFKSQRQIIIETKELIADTASLSKAEIDRTSRELGAAQSFLKQKYGQFLGDEFDSGTPQAMEAGPELEHDEDKDHDKDHDEHADETQKPETGHDHESNELHSGTTDKSGYSAIIEQFGHAHGEADDGNFIKKGLPSPKLLMKRAIGNMWQAELHLLLSQPELALPFENKALEFLNRAKKAERIYVKRLGFEPPPVSEQRRYQGDLSDILSYQRHETTPETITPIQHLSALLVLVNQYQNQHFDRPFDDNLTAAQNNLLEQAKTYFSGQLASTPEDITFIATLEKIQLADSFNLTNCENCISALSKKLWQLLPSPVAAPTNSQTPYSLQNNMLQKYQAFLQEHKKQENEGAQP